MKRKILLFTCLLILSVFTKASDKPFQYKPLLIGNKQASTFKFDPDKVTYGGNFGALFGSLTYVDISPFVGYRFTEKVMVGLGASYIYYRQRFTPTQVYQTHLYGGRLFSQYAVLPNIFLHGEMEALNFDYYDFLSGVNTRAWYVTPLLGGGYIQEIGPRSSLRVTALYAFNSENPKSPYYGNPLVFRIGIFL